MDFDRMLKNDMDVIAERVEAGIEKQEIETGINLLSR